MSNKKTVSDKVLNLTEDGVTGVLQIWPIEHLTPYAQNVKKHDKAQVAKIVASMTKFGFGQPIWVDRDGVIIAGHGRRLAAIEMGRKTVPVIYSKDLWGEKSRAARLADNRVAISDIDTEMLRSEMATLDEDLSDFFDAKELTFSMSDLGEMDDSAFLDDMDSALEEQRKNTEERAEAASSEMNRVPLAKAFGIKDVDGQGAKIITRLMAHIESSTGLSGDKALVAYAKEVCA